MFAAYVAIKLSPVTTGGYVLASLIAVLAVATGGIIFAIVVVFPSIRRSDLAVMIATLGVDIALECTGLFTKRDFKLDLRAKTITCPAGEVETFEPGSTVEFDPEACGACQQRANCTSAASGRGRSVSAMHDGEQSRGTQGHQGADWSVVRSAKAQSRA